MEHASKEQRDKTALAQDILAAWRLVYLSVCLSVYVSVRTSSLQNTYCVWELGQSIYDSVLWVLFYPSKYVYLSSLISLW